MLYKTGGGGPRIDTEFFPSESSGLKLGFYAVILSPRFNPEDNIMKQTLRFAKVLLGLLCLTFGLGAAREGPAPPGLLLVEASLVSIGLTILYTDWRKP
jgi:hypothetical protein